MTASPGRGRFGMLFSLLLLALLLLAVYRLPPDTTLAGVEELGVLRACVPTVLPPLVTAGSDQSGNDQSGRDQPGIDIEILQAIAERMGVRLQLIRNAAIGRDFNPRNWRLTRAQCLVVAGGVVDTLATRSYIDTTSPYLETGWAAVVTEAGSRLDGAGLDGARVGFHAGVTGLDRLALSSFLRNEGATVELLPTAGALRDGLVAGDFDIAVTDALSARVLAGNLSEQASGDQGFDQAGDEVSSRGGSQATAMWLSEPLQRHGLGLGVWKGDLTLKRRIEAILADLRADGTLQQILDGYELADIAETCAIC